MYQHFCFAAALALVLLPAGNGVNFQDWQPVLHPDLYDSVKTSVKSSFVGIPSGGSHHHHHHHQHLSQGDDQCEIYKVGFTQDLYFQYIQYKAHVPEMKEFTLCFWSKFFNHSNDHPIFSYAVDGQPKAISSWISNTDRSSYFSLSVEGHTFFRLNYPLRLNKWYHTCQSWNGKTGEWQMWVNAERVGRGFHNRLVGHVIPSGGLAITGQQQSQVGGGFLEGKGAPKGAGGMLGEITMVQLYSVALTAGKAHRDHKHHHAHQYDHNGNQITTIAPTTQQPRMSLPTHPLLTAGQINPALMLNFAGGQPTQAPPPPQPQIVPGQSFNAQFVNGQFVGSLVTQQLARQGGQGQQQAQQFIQSSQQLQQQPQQLQYLNIGRGRPAPLIGTGLVHSSLINPANVQFINTLDTHQLFKRQPKEEKSEESTESVKFGDKIKKTTTKRETETKTETKNHKKRELFISGGTIIDDTFTRGISLEQSLLDMGLGVGLAGIGENEPIIEEQKQNDEREPAEAEVKAVMSVCSGCDQEPFGKALVFGWRTVPKKLYSGAFYEPALPICKQF